MSKKITLSGWIAWQKWAWDDEPHYQFCPGKPEAEKSDHFERVALKEHSFEVEVPNEFDPRPELVKSLEEQERVLSAEFHKRVTEIRAQIQNLQALEFDGAVS